MQDRLTVFNQLVTLDCTRIKVSSPHLEERQENWGYAFGLLVRGVIMFKDETPLLIETVCPCYDRRRG